MSLKDKLSRVTAILNEQPSVENQSSLSTVMTKLNKALDDFLSKTEAIIYKNTAEFAELFALLNQPEHKNTVTLAWLNQHAAPTGKRLAKAGKKEKETFAVAMVGAGRAPSLIQELKESPKRKMQEELYSMTMLNDAEASSKIKAMKPKELEQFCRLNDIPVVKSAKGSIDKKKTEPHIIKKLESMREYLKL